MPRRHLKACLFAATLAGAPALAQEKPVPPPPTVSSYKDYAAFVAAFDAQAHTVTAERFLALAAQKGVVVADVRSRQDYERGHVKGAVFLGPDVTAAALAALAPSKGTTLLIYCTNSFTPSRMVSLTHVTAPQIAYLGWPNVYMLDLIAPQDRAKFSFVGRAP